jgi:hypothetical protein
VERYSRRVAQPLGLAIALGRESSGSAASGSGAPGGPRIAERALHLTPLIAAIRIGTIAALWTTGTPCAREHRSRPARDLILLHVEEEQVAAGLGIDVSGRRMFVCVRSSVAIRKTPKPRASTTVAVWLPGRWRFASPWRTGR